MVETGHSPGRLREILSDARRYASTLLICLTLFAITAAVFWPICEHGFILGWDDDCYVYAQNQVLNGISWKGPYWAATAEVAANWHPLTLLSLQLDAQLFGPSPTGFHRTAVLFHSVNAVLVFLALLTMTGCRWRSAAVAGMFALHPTRVESVAWISERKDVVSGFFFLLTLICYARYAKRPSVGGYCFVALFLSLGLCSKAMLVTTPCVLLLLDFWPLERFSSPAATGLPYRRRLIFEKLPLLCLCIMTSIATVMAQRSAIQNLSKWPVLFRLQNAVTSYCAYFLQTFWPSGISPHYARHDIPFVQFCGAFAILIAISWITIRTWHARPYLLVGWLWYLGMLVPVIGLIQVGHVARADRYLYLPQIGLFIMISWELSDLIRNSRRNTIAATGALAAYLVLCASVTYQQIPYWRDTKSLWQQVSRLDPKDCIAKYLLARAFYDEGNTVDAIRVARETLDYQDTPDGVVRAAMLLADCGDYESSVAAFNKALAFHPDDHELFSGRGKALAAQDKWKEAADDFRHATQLSPTTPSYQFFLAHSLAKAGQLEESQRVLGAALRQAPQWPQNAARMAWRMSTSSVPGTRVNFWPVCLAEQANLATNEDQPHYLDVLAAALANAGQYDRAICVARRAIQFADRSGQASVTESIRRRLEIYEKQRPYRE